MSFKPATFKPAKVASVEVTLEPETKPVVSWDLNSLVSSVVARYPQALQDCGMSAQQMVQCVVVEMEKYHQLNHTNISDLGANAAQNINHYSDEMLTHVRTGDLEGLGTSLNEVIGLAKGIDVQALLNKGSFVSKLFSSFKSTKEKILAQFNSVNKQLDRVVNEVEQQQSKLKERVEQLDTVFTHNLDEYKALTVSIILGDSVKEQLNQELNVLTTGQESLSAFQAQQKNDMSDLIGRIDKRIHDLKTLQMTAIQTAPMIRLVQSNNLTLIEKFNNIKMLTIPAWKKQFTLAISLIEQKKSVELANKIDDATNDLIKRNADLLHQNSVATAQANQRSTIDIETLEHVQHSLITTLEDVVSIEKEGAKNREIANQKMVEMKQELSNILR